jgi:hypothetical protein
VGVESPAVIAALDLVALKASAGKRHAAVRTGVAHGESPALLVAANDERLFKQHRGQ